MTTLEMEGGGSRPRHGADAAGPRSFAKLPKSPSTRLPTPGGGRITLVTDRVRARPAVTPTLSGAIGVAAMGLGLLGLVAPGRTARFFGLPLRASAVFTLFGLREMTSAFGLMSDPTDTRWHAFRLFGDVLDVGVLASAAQDPGNPRRGRARAAMMAVLAVTAMDAVIGQRMASVDRGCRKGGRS